MSDVHSRNSRKILKNGLIGSGVVALAVVIVTACTDQAKAKINMVHKEPPRPGVVAKIGGQEVTEQQLFADDQAELYKLEEQKYRLKMDRINKLLVENLIGPEAKKAGMSLDEYINKKIVKGEPKITDAEFKKFVTEKHISESQINPSIKEKINGYLQAMKRQELVTEYLSKVTKSNPVEVYIEYPKMPMVVEEGDAPFFGKKDAPVTIVEFSDFQCPYCKRAAETIDLVKKKYGGNKVKIAFKQFPLPGHENARPAAEASLCMNEQSSDKFWKFHDLAFKNQESLAKDALEKYAKEAGADLKKFNECVAAKKYAQTIQESIDYGNKVGIHSTPYFVVKKTKDPKQARPVEGAQPPEAFYQAIDDLMETK